MFSPRVGVQTHVLKLKPGDHTLVLKKNGIDVFSETIAVKQASEGVTFKKIDLVVTGSVIIKSSQRVGPRVAASVYVDDQSVKDWPVGTDVIEVEVEVGTRVIEVRMSKPIQKTILKETTKITKPGARIELMVK